MFPEIDEDSKTVCTSEATITAIPLIFDIILEFLR
jgi:hypothetical protein